MENGDYIKKEEAIKAVCKYFEVLPLKLVEDVMDMPSVDVVKVVRCKDCKFNKGKNKCLNEHSIIDIPKDDDYCSYGEREDDE